MGKEIKLVEAYAPFIQNSSVLNARKSVVRLDKSKEC